MTIRRALLSVSDKSGLVDFANKLAVCGVALISTGGTSRVLKDSGLEIMEVASVTGFPEIMDGRVKTLHPKIHGGLLALREDKTHVQAQQVHAIENIDLLVVNLYPFEEALGQNLAKDAMIENIDVGGPAMIRAAAKNHAFVTVIVDPADYASVGEEIATSGNTSLSTRKRLAAKAFARTASYDAAIANWFNSSASLSDMSYFAIGGKRTQNLRYGENPHQQAAAYKTCDRQTGILDALQIQGKELSYNNINDADAALAIVREFSPDTAACVIVKHANPCGVAIATSLTEAYKKALSCDPTSAYGGIIALNKKLDKTTAAEIAKLFTEIILAPEADDAARAILAEKKNLRLLLLASLASTQAPAPVVKTIAGGLLVQSPDLAEIAQPDLRCVTKRQPTPPEMQDMHFAMRVAKHVKSNAIVFAKDGATRGLGAGQMSRIDATHIAARKAQEARLSLTATSLASDAFFPFADGLIAAAEAGATAIIQPGGAMRDEDVIKAADARGLTMVFTGLRHFRH